jgi:hypothetical protein
MRGVDTTPALRQYYQTKEMLKERQRIAKVSLKHVEKQLAEIDEWWFEGRIEVASTIRLRERKVELEGEIEVLTEQLNELMN